MYMIDLPGFTSFILHPVRLTRRNGKKPNLSLQNRKSDSEVAAHRE